MIKRRSLIVGGLGLTASKVFAQPFTAPYLGSTNPSIGLPTDRAPGFNPNHPACNGISNLGGQVLSTIVGPRGTFINLVNGNKPSSIVSASLATTMDTIGPTINISGTDHQDFSGFGKVMATTGITMAMIFRPTFLPAFGVLFTQTSTGTLGPRLGTTSGKLSVAFQNQGVNSPFTLNVNVAYFGVASTTNITGLSPVNFALTRLDTGQIQSTSVANTFVPNAALDNVYRIGNLSTGAFPALAKIAAFAFTPAGLSIQQLLAWATDPWSFWYPSQRYEPF